MEKTKFHSYANTVSRRQFIQSSVALAGVLLLSSCDLHSSYAQESQYSSAASGVLLRRLGAHHANQIGLRLTRKPDQVKEWFSISGTDGAICIEGSTTSALLMGAHWYLRYVAGVSISWNGDSLSMLPDTLPAPAQQITREASAQHRFALNDTNDAYTGPYWEWDRWEWMIDVLALHGINEVLVYMGAEAVYQRTMRQFGYSNEVLQKWFPTPAHQPWWLLQNMSAWVGPSMPQHLIDSRAELGRRICDRLRELYMQPVLPGYYGIVPDGFMERHPGATIFPQGDWLGMKRPDWLAPTSEIYSEVASTYYREQAALLGPCKCFKMDPLHEGGREGSISVSASAQAIERELQRANPGATWFVLGWQDNPRTELLRGVQDKSKMLILDGLSDRYQEEDLEKKWENTPYAFGVIWNFGGHTTIGANLGVWNQRYFSQKEKSGSSQCGIAVMPEASCNNPAAFAFLTDIAWAQTPFNLERWFKDWSAYRYGKEDKAAAQAWSIAQQTVYGEPSGEWSESQDSLFSAQPSLTVESAANFSPHKPRYDMHAFAPAIQGLLAVDPKVRNSSAYRYDLIDFARQTIANESRTRLPKIKLAWDAKDISLFRSESSAWLARMEDLNQLVGAEPDYLLGPWLESALAAGRNEAERREFNFDARSVLLEWGPPCSASSGVINYANREWNGLLLHYRQRWKQFFNTLEESLNTATPAEKITTQDWFEIDQKWSRESNSYRCIAEQDFYSIATKVMSKA